jgi:serine/threonine protein kinase
VYPGSLAVTRALEQRAQDEEVMGRNAHAEPLPVSLAGGPARLDHEHAPALRSALPAPGTRVADKYILCDVLGTGGSAVVYAAEQLGLKRVVAFKLYPVSGALAASLLSRFEREAQLLARVRHENVVAVYDAGCMPDGSPYLVVQRLQGESLATRLLAGPPSLREVVSTARQVLSALVALSDAGITHCDIKPENLVFDRLLDGRTLLKLVDFGIAKEQADDTSHVLEEMVGTPRYMAPEQVRGERIDARCDLYALGVVLYEMLTGRTPHDGESVLEIARATLFAPITPVSELRPDCPPALSALVMKALARDPAERFQSARAMLAKLAELAPVAESAPLAAARAACDQFADTLRLPSFGSRAHPRHRRLKRGSIVAVTCLAALGCLALASELDARSRAQPARPLAQAAPIPTFALQADAGTALSALNSAGAGSVALLSQVRASAHQLLRSVRGEAQGDGAGR